MSSRNIVAGATRALDFALAQVLADSRAGVATLVITAIGQYPGADRGRGWGEGGILQNTLGRLHTGH